MSMFVVVGENISYDESEIRTYVVPTEDEAKEAVEKLSDFFDNCWYEKKEFEPIPTPIVCFVGAFTSHSPPSGAYHVTSMVSYDGVVPEDIKYESKDGDGTILSCTQAYYGLTREEAEEKTKRGYQAWVAEKEKDYIWLSQERVWYPRKDIPEDGIIVLVKPNYIYKNNTNSRIEETITRTLDKPGWVRDFFNSDDIVVSG